MESANLDMVGKNCKAFGKVEEVQKNAFAQGCLYSLKIKLSNDNKFFLFKATEKNTNIDENMCLPGFGYTFSGGEAPKVGDNIYLIAEYGWNNIINTGSGFYNLNQELINCGQYILSPFTFDYSGGENYEIMGICKISGKIENVVRFPDDKGFSNGLNIKILSSNNEFFNLGATELVFDKYGQSKVLGLSTTYPTISDDGSNYFPKNGDNFYALLDKSTNQILQVGKYNYDSNSTRPDCIGEKNNKPETSTGTTTKTGVLISTGSKIPNKKIEQNNVKTQKINKKTLNSNIKNKEIVKKDNTEAVSLGTGSNENNSISNTENILNKDNTNTGNEVINKQEEVISNTQTTTQTTKNNEIINQNSVNNSQSYVNYLIIFLFILTIIFILIKFLGGKKKR